MYFQLPLTHKYTKLYKFLAHGFGETRLGIKRFLIRRGWLWPNPGETDVYLRGLGETPEGRNRGAIVEKYYKSDCQYKSNNKERFNYPRKTLQFCHV